MTSFRPLLAAEASEEAHFAKLRYPLLASPKIDGIRVCILEGIAVTRSLKPVRNRYVQTLLGQISMSGMDGEVVAGDGLDPMTFRNTSTAVMSEHAQIPFTYWVFDDFTSNYYSPGEFEQRLNGVTKRVEIEGQSFIKALPHTLIKDFNELQRYEEEVLKLGFEGAMLRDPKGKYKYNRSTLNEGILVKLKRGNVRNGDAEIIGFIERFENTNEAVTNLLGYTERSSHKENLVGRGDLGSFLVRDTSTGYEFKIGIGVGLDDNLRKAVWSNQSAYLGKVIRYEWFQYGGYDKPRFPKFVAFRDPDDMS